MAYTPVGWQTGDTITADRLNRMDRGWSVETTELFSETVTTVESSGVYSADLAYSQLINADTITVNFDGTEYTCPRIDNGGFCLYGGFNDGPDFTTYPFYIFSKSQRNQLITQTAGTHTVSVTYSTLQTSAGFDKARGYGYVTGGPTELFSETVTAAGGDSGMYGAELTYSQLIDAASIIVTYDGTEYECPSIGAGEYGAPYNDGNPDFSEFPFNLYTGSGNPASLVTQTAGEHTISVVASVSSMQTSADFIDAVNPIVEDAIAATPTPFLVNIGTTTWSQVNSALKAGRTAFVWNHTTINKQPDTYEFVAEMKHTAWKVYTLTVVGGAVVVNTYQASSQTSALELVAS